MWRAFCVLLLIAELPALLRAGDVPTDNADLREVKVLCIADETYRSRFPEWKDRIAEIVSRATRDLEAQCALRFTMTACRPWPYNSKNAGTTYELMTQLLAIPPAPADIVIAFVGTVQAANVYRSGHLYYQQAWSIPFGQHVMVSDIRKEQVFAAEQLLVQRLCTVFGAFSVADRRSIMNNRLENVEPGPIRLGDVTQQVIRWTHDFDFHRGPASLSPEAISNVRELYRKYRHVDSAPGDDPITNGYRARRFYRSNSPPPGPRTA
jgi:hypothetical protein